MAGKLIVLYGINNLGKSTQAKLLVDRLQQAGYSAIYLKYPIYELEPSGPLLNDYLREGNPLQLLPREAQIIYALNRFQYQPELEKQLAAGQWVIAEDYTGTGLAWGWGAGAKLNFLEAINQGLHQPDLALWLDGERFLSGIEQNHKHESNNELMNKVRDCHRQLAERYGWPRFDANQAVDPLNEQLWQAIKALF
jgi:dTMP kinase